MKGENFPARRIGSAVLMAGTLLFACLSFAVTAQDGAPAANDQGDGDDRPVLVLDLQDAIGPATADFVSRSLEQAAERDAELLVIRMDTPGGLDAATRDIIKDILASPVPVATFVTPEGARAASAGAYILLASHVAAMSPATNVGAATPVNIMGGGPKPPGAEPASDPDPGQDEEEGGAPPDGPAPADASMRKVLNDSVAYIRGLAERRGRNADWAEKAVREADSITAEQALELGVIDLVARNLGDLLSSIDGREVEVLGQQRSLATKGKLVEQLEPDWRNEFLAAITSPTIAYLLLLVGIYGLILEGYNPGAFLPGVVGAICLLLALYSLQMLPVNYVGLALIGLGVILMIAEAIAPSFGVLGIGGIIALVFGSIMLIDTEVPGMGVSRPLIGAIAAVGGVGLMGIIAVAMKARRRPLVAGREQLIGARGEAMEDFSQAGKVWEGEVWLHSERWTAVAENPLRKEQPVEVTGIDGLELRVRAAGQPSE